MARLINIGRFFQRIESVFVFIWAMAALLYLTTISFYVVYSSQNRWFEIYKTIDITLAVITFSAVFIPHNLNDVINILTEIVYKIIGLAGFVFIL